MNFLRKYFFIFLTALCCNLVVNAQEDKGEDVKIGNLNDAKLKAFKYKEGVDSLRPWRITGNMNVGFSQTALINWAPGGNNVIGINALGFLKAEYTKNRFNWVNTVDVGFGMQKIADQEFRKSDDRLEINSQVNYKVSPTKPLFYSIMMNFRSQFANGYEYPSDTNRILTSRGLSPGFLTLGLGIDYKPTTWFNVFLSPVTSKTVFVLDNTTMDETRYGIEEGEKVFQNLGAFLSARLNKEIVKNVTVNTQLNLFSNYLQNPQNIDINWLTSINLKVNKFLSVALLTELVYDDDIAVPKKNDDGTTYKGKGTQFRQVLTIGLGYQFNNEKKQKKK